MQLQTSAFNLTWERRLDENGTVHLIDECQGNKPLFFQFAPFDQQLSTFDLTTLARRWQQVDGMAAGLTTLTDCNCIHIDRCMKDAAGNLVKCDSALQPEAECLLPILMGPTTDYQLLEYTVTPLMAHLGGDGCGHYRAALRVAPGVTDDAKPYMWLMTDDWSQAVPTWTLPPWFVQNTTMAWAVRSDKVQLYDRSLHRPFLRPRRQMW